MKKFHNKSIWRPATVHLKHLCLVLRNMDFSERAAQFPNLKLRKSKGTQTCLLGPKNSAPFTWRTCWDFLACDQNRSTSDENTKTLRDMSLWPSLRWLSDILERLNDLQQSGIKRSRLESAGTGFKWSIRLDNRVCKTLKTVLFVGLQWIVGPEKRFLKGYTTDPKRSLWTFLTSWMQLKPSNPRQRTISAKRVSSKTLETLSIPKNRPASGIFVRQFHVCFFWGCFVWGVLNGGVGKMLSTFFCARVLL